MKKYSSKIKIACHVDFTIIYQLLKQKERKCSRNIFYIFLYCDNISFHFDVHCMIFERVFLRFWRHQSRVLRQVSKGLKRRLYFTFIYRVRESNG